MNLQQPLPCTPVSSFQWSSSFHTHLSWISLSAQTWRPVSGCHENWFLSLSFCDESCKEKFDYYITCFFQRTLTYKSLVMTQKNVYKGFLTLLPLLISIKPGMYSGVIRRIKIQFISQWLPSPASNVCLWGRTTRAVRTPSTTTWRGARSPWSSPAWAAGRAGTDCSRPRTASKWRATMVMFGHLQRSIDKQPSSLFASIERLCFYTTP